MSWLIYLNCFFGVMWLLVFSVFSSLSRMYGMQCVIVLRDRRCIFMEEGSFCLIGAAYPGSGAPADKRLIPRDRFGIFGNSLSIVI